jgi:hypothetical protein
MSQRENRYLVRQLCWVISNGVKRPSRLSPRVFRLGGSRARKMAPGTQARWNFAHQSARVYFTQAFRECSGFFADGEISRTRWASGSLITSRPPLGATS